MCLAKTLIFNVWSTENAANPSSTKRSPASTRAAWAATKVAETIHCDGRVRFPTSSRRFPSGPKWRRPSSGKRPVRCPRMRSKPPRRRWFRWTTKWHGKIRIYFAGFRCFNLTKLQIPSGTVSSVRGQFWRFGVQFVVGDRRQRWFRAGNPRG